MTKPTKLKVLGVLMWHHFCYYKRHRVMLILNLFLPAVIALCAWGLLRAVDPSEIYASDQKSDLANLTDDGWLLPYSASKMREDAKKLPESSYQGGRVQQRYVNGTRQFLNCASYSASGPGDVEDGWFTPLTESEEQLLVCMDTFFKIMESVDTSDFYKFDLQTWYDQEAASLPLLLLGDIVYFPNNTDTVEKVVQNIRSSLKDFFQIPIDIARKSGNENSTSTADQCFSNLEKRVKGFATKSDAIRYVKTHLIPSQKLENYCHLSMPNLWGAVNFQSFESEHNHYSIIQDIKAPEYAEYKGLQLQSVVEHAILKAADRKPELNLVRQTMPNKCWKITNVFVGAMMDMILSLLVVMGFIAFALNCTYLMVSEKTLRLREYMAIMGVTTPFLKFSWFLFYSVYLILACTVVTILLMIGLRGFFPSGMSYLLLFLFLFTVNIARLSYTYVLAAILQKTDNINTLVTTIDSVVWVITIFTFKNLASLNGAKLVAARLASFHFIVPGVIGCYYFVQWANIWLGLGWDVAWLTPYETDYYGGLGACFLHLLLDIIVYFLVSWYIENVFPGEFGQKQPFYFCFDPSYWRGSQGSERKNSRQKEVSEMLKGSGGIRIHELSKIYPNGFVALSEFTETFRVNEITAFLGKNGAGKSTTMNMMVGLVHPSSGTIQYKDLDVKKDLASIREKIGFVPQYDILYPDLTLMEHAKFYGWLRGLTSDEIDICLKDQLVKLDLDQSVSNTATKLSGGQKRKLSLLIAYFGNPEYVILDEPTSGVDPFSARNIWDTILSKRQSTTTVLSTHQMDEADLLSDWITMIDSGEFKCSGTPLQLKEQYGQGFRVVISPGQASSDDVEALKQLMMQNLHLGNSEGKSCNIKEENGRRITGVGSVFMEGTDIICKIPKEIVSTQAMVDSLKLLETRIEELDSGVTYGVTEPSLEEVFFKATSPDEQGLPKVEKSAADVSYKPASGFVDFLQQAQGQLIKRFWNTVTSWLMCAYQIILPLMFIGLMFLITSSISEGSKESYQDVVLDAPYRDNLWFVKGSDSGSYKKIVKSMLKDGMGRLEESDESENNIEDQAKALLEPVESSVSEVGTSEEYSKNCPCRGYCVAESRSKARQAQSKNLPGGGKIFGVNGVINLNRWIVIANSTPDMIMGGFQYEEPNLGIYAKKGFMPAVLNGINNVLLRSNGAKHGSAIKYSLELIKLDESENKNGQHFKKIQNDMLQVMFIMFAFMSATKGIAVFIMNEKEFGLKRLQFLANANRVVYWMCNFFWDMCCFMVTLAIICIILVAVNNPFSDFVPYLLPVIIPYGMLMVTHIYFLSMFFRKTSYLTTTIEVLAVVFLVASSVLAVFDNMSRFNCDPRCHIAKYSQSLFRGTASSDEDQALSRCIEKCGRDFGGQYFFWAKYVNPFLRFHPLHLLVEGLTCFALMILSVRSMGMDLLKLVGDISVNEKINIMYGGRILHYRYLGRSITFGILGTILYMSLTLVLEYVVPNGYSCFNRLVKTIAPVFAPTDPDVEREEQKTMALPAGDTMALHDGERVPLVVKELTKSFKSMGRPAVHKVTFSIPNPETFGLLGVNGAGKTTTFKMLAGFETPDHGTCEIDGYDVQKSPLNAEKNIMYCPQENILSKGLSVRRHLDIFGRFMRIPKDARSEIVENLIHEVGLDTHENKAVGTLSGGNQRKVQLALALMGYPKMIFLDEPTTGMDPMARRLTWDAINRAVSKGSAVVLTSHSMEECEVLCHRLVIMVAGRLKCIGSVQYLKNKLGNRYTFKLRLEKPSLEDSEAIKSDIASVFGSDARLLEHHSTVLHYEIDSEKLGNLSKLFSVLIRCQENFHVQSFTVSQVTLEHVFVNMAKRAVEEEEAAKLAINV